jgi:hypothetical protein
LQNADDAGATEAFANIEDGAFVFRHNGEDFKKEHFESLCRFGYSNKRALHTIGFRGIGFKSTFSLGDRVELTTKSLAVAFDKSQFTRPIWRDDSVRSDDLTEVRVKIANHQREKELAKNLTDWLFSPISLLFFRSIRRLTLLRSDLHWGSFGPGPVPESEWMALHEKPDETFLLVRSAYEEFPNDALAEIQQERLLSTDEGASFPPCRVEIVLGTTGRLYVVLPTGVTTKLPFACNAPFIQDPARLKIKEPEISPTNRWLLQRAGILAASTMLAWLGDANASVKERAGAYDLLPDPETGAWSLEEQVAAAVANAFTQEISDKAVLLLANGELVGEDEAIAIPTEISSVWPERDITRLFDSEGRPALAAEVASNNRQKLFDRNLLTEVDGHSVLLALTTARPPQPATWGQLLKLWAFLPKDIGSYTYSGLRNLLNIIPVQGSDILSSPSAVSRIGEKRVLQSEDDWQFLAGFIRVVNQNWTRWLAQQRREAADRNDVALQADVENAFTILTTLGLDETSDANKLIQQVGSDFFKRPDCSLGQSVRLTQIAAKLSANVGGEFQYWTSNGQKRSAKQDVVANPNRSVDHLVSAEWGGAHLIHPDYERDFQSCTADEWTRWIDGGKSALLSFVPLKQKHIGIWGRHNITKTLAAHGYLSEPYYHFVTSDFRFIDWDFDESHWKKWEELASEDASVWGEVLELILKSPEDYSPVSKSASASQVATTGNTKNIASALTPSWLMRFQTLPCIPDTHRIYRKPEELLLRTPETEAFRDIEPFIHASLDTERNRSLLKAFGVRDEGLKPDRILAYLRALSKSETPPTKEVDKWYRRLDELVDTCSTEDLEMIRDAFANERIVLTNDLDWTTRDGVFLSADELDAPGVAVVRRDVADLSLWHKVGVPERPTAESAIRWVESFSEQATPTTVDAKRIRTIMIRYPSQVWVRCGHWFSLNGDWVTTEHLEYALSMQSLVKWNHLHEWVKGKTADLLGLPADVCNEPPFATLIPLAAKLDERVVETKKVKRAETKAWLRELGDGLQRLIDEPDGDTERVRALARNLSETVWQSVTELEIIPYIDGTPAGTARDADVLWLDQTIFVRDRPAARLARSVASELSRFFRKAELADAAKMCFERSPEFVREYMEENFRLGAIVPASAGQDADRPGVDGKNDVEVPITQLTGVAPQAIDAETTLAEDSGSEEQQSSQPEDSQQESITVETRQIVTSTVTVRPTLIESFAAAGGFQKRGEDRFVHADGRSLIRDRSDRFSLQLVAASGGVIRSYFAIARSLEKEPIEMDAEIWAALEHFPHQKSLILESLEGTPIEMTGEKLLAQKNAGLIKLYPAKYRVVYGLPSGSSSVLS